MKAVKVSLLFLFLLVLFISPRQALSGTVESATLSPTSSAILAGASQEITFSALNDKGFALKDYKINIPYAAGLTVTGLSVSPGASTAGINTKRHYIELFWENVEADVELQAAFQVSAEAGEYLIPSSKSVFHDFNKGRYTGTCSSATVSVAADMVPPLSPTNVRSYSGEGSIQISWSSSTESDLAGYTIYRRISEADYEGPYSSVSASSASYIDTDVEVGVPYSYVVTAVDSSGNESAFSTETRDRILDSVIRTYPFSGPVKQAAAGDLNGDGEPDMVLGFPYYYSKKMPAGRVEIFLGGNTTTSPDMRLLGENSGDYFGYSLAVVDLNDDGFDDLIVGAPYCDVEKSGSLGGTAYEAGKVYLYAGGPQFSTSPVLVLEGSFAYTCDGTGIYSVVSERLGLSMSPAGDVNGDGYMDVVIGVPMGGAGRSGKVVFLLGGETVPSETVTFTGPHCDEQMGSSVAPAGDVNRDGFDDVIVGALADEWSPPPGKAYLFYGGNSIQLSNVVFREEKSDFGKSVAGLDINGDGFSDIAVASGDGIDIYYGGMDVNTQSDAFLAEPSAASDFVSCLGDLDNDGASELGMNGPTAYWGHNQGKFVKQIIDSSHVIVGLGDVDKDGLKDIFAYGPEGSPDFHLFTSAPYASLPRIVLDSPSGDNVTTDSPNLDISGSVNGAVTRVSITGGEVTLLEGRFNHPAGLNPGSNVIEIIAQTEDGKLSKRSLNVTFTPAPLAVRITSALNDTPDKTHTQITGTISDPSAVVTVNASAATVSETTFQADVPSADIGDAVTVHATDDYGQSASHSIPATLLAAGGNGAIAGSVTNPDGSPLSGVTVTLTDSSATSQTATTDSNGFYTVSTPNPGDFTATFEAKALAYKKETVTGTVLPGQTLIRSLVLSPLLQPTVAIEYPEDGAVVQATPVTVSGSVTPDEGVVVTVNGVPASVSGNGFSASIPLVEGSETITATATDAYDRTASDSVEVTVQFAAPTVEISAEPVSILAGTSSTLTWDSTNANTVTISGIGEVSTTGLLVVSPTETTTFAITATGPGGTSEASVTVTVTYPQPMVSLSALPNPIAIGESATLSWSSTYAESVTIDNGIGSCTLEGSVAVSPGITTTYTATATGLGGTSTASVTVTVNYPVPTVSLGADPGVILTGEKATLTWSSNHANTATIDPGIGTVSPSGSTDVSPTATTTYTLTATGLGGTSTAQTTVTVLPAPTVALRGEPTSVESGESVTLTWTSANADTCVIEPGVGPVNADDSATVLLTETTTYTITAANKGGTCSASFRIYVKEPAGYAYGDPTPAEQAFLEAVNRARLDPEREASRLGIDLLEGIPEGTISGEPAQPLVFNSKLLQSAYLHSQDMVVNRYYSHYSQDGGDWNDRMINAGYQVYSSGENLGGDCSTIPLNEVESVLRMHDGLFIDDGVEGRYHRVNILGQSFKEMGVGEVSGPFETYPYCYLLTSDFGAASQEESSFLLGVVYDDQNGDGIYTAGEGIGNAEISVLESGLSTLTASAGGYGLPLPPGYYTVQATLADGQESSREITITNRNVKVDFLTTDFIFKAPTITMGVDHQTIKTGESATLTWTSTNADACVIEPVIGSVDPNGSITVSPTEMTTYTITATGAGGAASASVTVCVYDPSSRVAVIMDAEPTAIEAEESTVLIWTSEGADSCLIEPGIGNVAANGSMAVSPSETTKYTIIATGQGGTAMSHTTVTVNHPYARINGTVVDGVKGNPLEGVTVTATDSLQMRSTQTDPTGAFEMNTVSPGAVVLLFSKAGFTRLETTLTLEGGQTRTMNVSLNETAGASVSGTITDKLTGDPLQGATVTVVDGEKTLSTTASSDGSYSLGGILPGAVEITAGQTGYLAQTSRLSFPDEQTYFRDFALYPESAMVTVTGTITNAMTLEPESEVRITLVGTDNTCVSLEDGSFILTNVPMGENAFKVFKEEFADVTWNVDVNTNPYVMNVIHPMAIGVTYPQEIDSNITGYVFDALTAKPLAGAIIRVFGTSIESTTDQNGQYAFSDLPYGEIHLIAMALDHKAVSMYPTVVSGAASRFNFNLPPTTKGRIVGTVTDVDTGEPIRYATVSLGEGSLLAANTEADGTYTLVGVPAGNYTASVTHSTYMPSSVENIDVADGSQTATDFLLKHKPVTGSLEGVITDREYGDPVEGVALEVEGTSVSGFTDSNGYYTLHNLPAGLVNIAISAGGYPYTTRTAAIVADTDYSTSNATSFDIELDSFDPEPPDTISGFIGANDGGSIETHDKRFLIYIPPGSLSDDAIVSLMPPSGGPISLPGDELNLDPELGISDIKSVSKMTQLVLEPAVPGGEIPTLRGWIILTGRYFQSDVDGTNIAESSIFPYYWDGTYWTVMQVMPHETAVDEINNRYVSVVNFTTTETGKPVVAKLGLKQPILVASIDEYIPNLNVARIFLFNAAGAVMGSFVHPNTYIYDKDEIEVIASLTPEKTPNPNALPLLIIHGWDPNSVMFNQGRTDPNTDKRYRFIVEDLVNATNGVYRPMFATHNSRAGIVSIGNDLVNRYESLNIKGLPAETGKEPDFPYFDTFGFSMGGLISRCIQSNSGEVHNMVIVGTPNHGTHSALRYFDYIPVVSDLKAIIASYSPGTKDLFPYDDEAWLALLSGNPTLYNLNRSSSCAPQADMTLMAGTDGVLDSPYLLGENDKAVPVDSVFCRTSNQNDGDKSWLEVNPPAHKYEYKQAFNHFDFGGELYRIRDHQEVEASIVQGLSDWVVGKVIDSNVIKYDDDYTIQYVEASVEIEYNVIGRDFDRVALVIYGQDGALNWHVCGGYASPAGNITYADEIRNNSADVEPLRISTSHLFGANEAIWRVIIELVPLKPGQTTVPLEPNGNFGMPVG
jgi:uncharacterized protein YkwD